MTFLLIILTIISHNLFYLISAAFWWLLICNLHKEVWDFCTSIFVKKKLRFFVHAKSTVLTAVHNDRHHGAGGIVTLSWGTCSSINFSDRPRIDTHGPPFFSMGCRETSPVRKDRFVGTFDFCRTCEIK